MMDVKKLCLIILSVTTLPLLNSQDIGDPCPGGQAGACVLIKDCTSALKNIKLRKKPQLCSFRDQVPIICCSDLTPQPKPIPTMMTLDRRAGRISSIASTTATATTISTESISIFEKDENLQGCPPLSSNLTAPMTGQKAFDKCLYYQEQYLYPCVESPLPGQHKMRADFCAWRAESLIINGQNASRGEFPHMALLGFGTTTVDWKCGGVIVSPKFVLTVAHCSKSSYGGRVTKIKIGILNRSEPISNNNVYNILKIHKHEGYHSPLKYNDIALLETDREMLLNPLALPACLHDGSPVNDTEVIVAGWGVTDINTLSQADNLQKAYLTKFQDSECISHHQRFRNRNLLHGIDIRTQMCLGNKINRTDTCGGDSGGPAQIRHPRVYCMYLVLGLTSYGRSCGHVGEPGVYTRVSHYLSWIESIVWP